MSYQSLMYMHLATVLPAFVIGTGQLVRRKGTPPHRALGKVYLVLIFATGVITLFMPAQVGPRFLGHFGFIHAFSILALYSAPMAWVAARRGRIGSHSGYMIGLYVGGILIAGTLAFSPGRMLHRWAFGAPAPSSASGDRP